MQTVTCGFKCHSSFTGASFCCVQSLPSLKNSQVFMLSKQTWKYTRVWNSTCIFFNEGLSVCEIHWVSHTSEWAGGDCTGLGTQALQETQLEVSWDTSWCPKWLHCCYTPECQLLFSAVPWACPVSAKETSWEVRPVKIARFSAQTM